MSLASKIERNPNIAVFTRNYDLHLENAAKRFDRLNTFRSSLRWTSAHEAVEEHGFIKLYSAVIDGDNFVRYEAILVRVKLDPSKDDQTTQRLLRHSVGGTESEGLWGESVKTLYAIRNCRKLLVPFPVNKLIKLGDSTPISENYEHGYSIVEELSF